MSTLQKIRNQIAGARKKVAHATSVIALAERRIERWRKKRDRHEKGSPGYARAARKLRFWSGVLRRARQARHDWQVILTRRISKKERWLKKHRDPGPVPNLATLDGHQVPGWIAEILKEARAAGAWHGSVISGYRSPAYSESLCMAICGRPSCPGTCAGRASNHAAPPSGRGVPYEGAVDVSDPYSLESFCRRHNKPLYGGGYALPYDHPHFSASGR